MPSNSSSSATLPRFDASLPPTQPDLHAKHQTLTKCLNPAYWTQLNPTLHVGDAAYVSNCKPIKAPKDRLKDLRQQINDAGVAQVGRITGACVHKLPGCAGRVDLQTGCRVR